MNRVQAYRPLGRLNKQQRDGYCVERSGCSPKTTVSIALTAVVEEAAMVRHHWASNREQYLLANPAYLDVQFCNYWTWSRRGGACRCWGYPRRGCEGPQAIGVLGDQSLTGTLAAH